MIAWQQLYLMIHVHSSLLSSGRVFPVVLPLTLMRHSLIPQREIQLAFEMRINMFH